MYRRDVLSDIMKTASSLQIRGFGSGKEESFQSEQLDSPASLGVFSLLGSSTVTTFLSVVDDQFDFSEVENEKFQNIKTSSRKTSSMTKKSDGRKSSAPRKVSVCEGEEDGLDSTRYSILGSYLSSCKRPTHPLTVAPPDPPEPPGGLSSGGESREDGEDRDLVIDDHPVEDEPQQGYSLSNLALADRLRHQLLANIPSQSYNWLNSCQEQDKIARIKPEKHPLGGIKTGEIGPNGKPSVKCEECGKLLADPSSLYRHRKIHTGDKPHQCPHCPRSSTAV